MDTTMIDCNNQLSAEEDIRMEEVEEKKEDDMEVFTLGITNMVKTKVQLQLDPEVFEDVKYIFHASFDPFDEEEEQPLEKPEFTYNLPRPYRLSIQTAFSEFQTILEMPRRLPKDHDFSDNLVLIFEAPATSNVMVFLIAWCEETQKVSLFHAFTKKFYTNPYCRTIGYAAMGRRLYLVGGNFKSHHFLRCADDAAQQLKLEQGVTDDDDYVGDLFLDSVHVAQRTRPKNLNVPFFNLETREWEDDSIPHFKGPKPKPIVFVYHGKIFALKGYHPYPIHDNSPPFEVLDTKSKSYCARRNSWNSLPPPPFHMQYYSHHLLDEQNGIFYLFFNLPGDSSDATRICCELELNVKLLKWRHNTFVSASDPQVDLACSRVGLGMSYLSPEDCSRGCIVDNMFFSYKGDHNSGEPVILGHDLSQAEIKFEQWVIRGLDKIFGTKFEYPISYGFLNHIGNLRFCLVIKYHAGNLYKTNTIYSLTFDLVKETMDLEHKRKKNERPAKTRADKFNFSLKHVCDGAFQVPTGLVLPFCKKLDGGVANPFDANMSPSEF